MRNSNIVWLAAIALIALASCVDYLRPEFDVEKPESIAELEYLNDYDVLKSYIDSVAYPDFKLGAGVNLGAYAEQGPEYSMISSNFNNITAGYGMKHGALVQDDGSIDFSNVIKFIEAANAAGISIYGHTLCWHSNQNGEYLNSTIAPEVVHGTGEASWDTVTIADFETDDASNYQSSNAILSFTADGEGADGVGRALQILNEEVRDNDWNSQFFLKFSPKMEFGEKFRLTMAYRADDACSFTNQAHSSPGSYLHWNFFGAMDATAEWAEFAKEITIDSSTMGAGAIAFNLGNTATNYYMDNIILERYDLGEGSIVEKTAEEKEAIISAELERWISGMMEVTGENVKAWDVVNEPMDDGSPYQLKSGIGKDPEDDKFYWQDYLGKDYAVKAFELARTYGNEDDILFINDYNLEYNIDKCKGLIAYVEYIESKGQVVDGIGTQMHISTDSDKAKIDEMFTLLAATGKMIKVSELDIGVGEKTTDATTEHYIAQAEMYKYVVEKYFELIPAAQRYGITVWSPKDQARNSYWRAGEPVGLWTEEYQRKRAYGGFADGLLSN